MANIEAYDSGERRGRSESAWDDEVMGMLLANPTGVFKRRPDIFSRSLGVDFSGLDAMQPPGSKAFEQQIPPLEQLPPEE